MVSRISFFSHLCLTFFLFFIVLFPIWTSAAEEKDEKSSNETERYKLAVFDFHHVEMPYVVCLWVLLAAVAKIAFHLFHKLPQLCPESCLLIILGIVVGSILYFSRAATVDQYVLNADTFFLFLLPPIIFDAGYFMPNRSFFDNIGTILLLAVINTLFNTAAIGLSLWGVSSIGWISSIPLLRCIIFSALISAVDPVAVLAVFEDVHINEMLYIIVFGESLLNDGVTVVVYHMIEGFLEIGENNIIPADIILALVSFFIIALGGTLIGLLFGFFTGFITKYTKRVRVAEPLFVFVLAYMSYLTAEMFHLSSILALTFCGISMKQYVEANVSHKSQITIKYFTKLLANISETVIFMFLGLSTVVNTHVWSTGFVCFAVLFCLIYRAIGVMAISWLVNRVRLIRLTKIDQFIMSYGGLRGGIAFCLSLLLKEELVPEKHLMITTTIVVVFFTVFVQGITIKPVVNAMKVEKNTKIKQTMNAKIQDRFLDHLMAGIEDIVGRNTHHSMRDKFEQIDLKYIKPLLTKDKPKTRETDLFQVFRKINIREAVDYISKHGNFNLSEMKREPSFAKLVDYEDRSMNGSFSDINEPNSSSELRRRNVPYSKKIADDIKIHHILDDSMFQPRKTWTPNISYDIPEVKNHPPFKHNTRSQLRRFMSLTGDRAPSPRILRTDMYGSGNGGQLASDNVSKSVSFTELPERNDRDSPSEGDYPDKACGDSGITFTLSPNSVVDYPPKYEGMIPAEETAIDKELPWKRTIVQEPVTVYQAVDDMPQKSEIPSWAGNPAYHRLTESGSPYMTPENTLNAPPPSLNLPSVFSVFPVDEQEKQDIPFPPPWEKKDTTEAPLTSPEFNTNGTVQSKYLHSSHDSPAPLHHNVIVPAVSLGDNDGGSELTVKKSEPPGAASSKATPKHFQMIELSTSPHVQIELEEMHYQENMKNRVEEWLHHPDSDSASSHLMNYKSDDDNIDMDFEVHL